MKLAWQHKGQSLARTTDVNTRGTWSVTTQLPTTLMSHSATCKICFCDFFHVIEERLHQAPVRNPSHICFCALLWNTRKTANFQYELNISLDQCFEKYCPEGIKTYDTTYSRTGKLREWWRSGTYCYKYWGQRQPLPVLMQNFAWQCPALHIFVDRPQTLE